MTGFNKQKALDKFREENPKWFNGCQIFNLEKRIEREKREIKKLKLLERLVYLRYVKELTFERIGKIYGVDRQNIEQIIKRAMGPRRMI